MSEWWKSTTDSTSKPISLEMLQKAHEKLKREVYTLNNQPLLIVSPTWYNRITNTWFRYHWENDMRKIFPTYSKKLISMIIDILGITQADIKRIDQRYNADIYRIKTWNRRTFIISGQELYNRRLKANG